MAEGCGFQGSAATVNPVIHSSGQHPAFPSIGLETSCPTSKFGRSGVNRTLECLLPKQVTYHLPTDRFNTTTLFYLRVIFYDNCYIRQRIYLVLAASAPMICSVQYPTRPRPLWMGQRGGNPNMLHHLRGTTDIAGSVCTPATTSPFALLVASALHCSAVTSYLGLLCTIRSYNFYKLVAIHLWIALF